MKPFALTSLLLATSILLTACGESDPTRRPDVPLPNGAILGLQGCDIDIRPRLRKGFAKVYVDYEWVTKDMRESDDKDLKLYITPYYQNAAVEIAAGGTAVHTVRNTETAEITLHWNVGKATVDAIAKGGSTVENIPLQGTKNDTDPLASPAFVEEEPGQIVRLRCFRLGYHTTLVLRLSK